MRPDAQLVPHGPTNDQQGSRKARQFGDERFQSSRVSVIEENVVAESRTFDGCKHGGGGARRYIAFRVLDGRRSRWRSREGFEDGGTYCGNRTQRLLERTKLRESWRRH